MSIFFFREIFSVEQVFLFLKRFWEADSIVVKLFVLGNPGCGKSTIIRSLEKHVQTYGWISVCFNDYEILSSLFLEDSARDSNDRWFVAAEHGGFNVVNFDACDVALVRLEQAAGSFSQGRLAAVEPIFALIEFSRNDYLRAFRQFRPDFLQDSCFLYLATEIEQCQKRIYERISKKDDQKTKDDYYVSAYIFDVYYNTKQEKSFVETLVRGFQIDPWRVIVLDNNEDLLTDSPEFQCLVERIMQQITLDGQRYLFRDGGV